MRAPLRAPKRRSPFILRSFGRDENDDRRRREAVARRSWSWSGRATDLVVVEQQQQQQQGAPFLLLLLGSFPLKKNFFRSVSFSNHPTEPQQQPANQPTWVVALIERSEGALSPIHVVTCLPAHFACGQNRHNRPTTTVLNNKRSFCSPDRPLGRRSSVSQFEWNEDAEESFQSAKLFVVVEKGRLRKKNLPQRGLSRETYPSLATFARPPEAE